jgi:WD40 repeat protein
LSGHDGAINSLCFFSDGLALASASEDTTCRLWDLRSSRQLNQFVVLPDSIKQSSATSSTSVTPRPAVSSAAFGGGERVSRTVPTSISCSSSGRILFVGYDDCLCRVWDTIDATSIQVRPFFRLSVCLLIVGLFNPVLILTGSRRARQSRQQHRRRTQRSRAVHRIVGFHVASVVVIDI